MDISKLKAVRTGHRGAITRLLRKFDEISSSTDSEVDAPSDIRVILETLRQKKDQREDPRENSGRRHFR